jgi:hypothetical protein
VPTSRANAHLEQDARSSRHDEQDVVNPEYQRLLEQLPPIRGRNCSIPPPMASSNGKVLAASTLNTERPFNAVLRDKSLDLHRRKDEI